MPRDYLREEQSRTALQSREAAENARAIETARREKRSVTFIAHDGCEVTAFPDGRILHNASDWF